MDLHSGWEESSHVNLWLAWQVQPGAGPAGLLQQLLKPDELSWTALMHSAASGAAFPATLAAAAAAGAGAHQAPPVAQVDSEPGPQRKRQRQQQQKRSGAPPTHRAGTPSGVHGTNTEKPKCTAMLCRRKHIARDVATGLPRACIAIHDPGPR